MLGIHGTPPPSEAAPRKALLRSPDRSAPPHGTVVGALEAAAAADAPLLTLHTSRDPIDRPARALLEGARRWRSLLGTLGTGRSEPVVILLPTSPEFVEALLGTMLAGAVPAPLASPLTFGSLDRYLDNLAAIVEDSGARVLITSDRIARALSESNRLRSSLAHVVTPADLGTAEPTDPRSRSLAPADPALLQYTSGTTGRPKGALISHGALTANAHSIASGLRLGPQDVGVSWLPMFHDMGLIGVLITAVCHPYPVHLMRPDTFVMRPGKWLDLIARVGGTLSAAPNFAYDLCVSRAGQLDGRLDGWRVALNGAEPVHASTVHRFADRYAAAGFDLGAMMPVYGMAEATLAITFPQLERKLETTSVDREALERDHRAVASARDDAFTAVSCGGPVAGMSVRIARDGSVLCEGEVGEIEVRGPSLMDSYYRNEEASAETLVDGWLRTGDLGFVDDGRLFVVGRAKDVIIKAGRNIHPHDVERVATQIDGVRGGAAAFARSNTDTGTDDLVVVVETRSGDDSERERIAKEVRGELLAALGVKADEVHLWPVGSLPRTTSGKIRRRACAGVLEEGGPR